MEINEFALFEILYCLLDDDEPIQGVVSGLMEYDYSKDSYIRKEYMNMKIKLDDLKMAIVKLLENKFIYIYKHPPGVRLDVLTDEMLHDQEYQFYLCLTDAGRDFVSKNRRQYYQ